MWLIFLVFCVVFFVLFISWLSILYCPFGFFLTFIYLGENLCFISQLKINWKQLLPLYTYRHATVMPAPWNNNSQLDMSLLLIPIHPIFALIPLCCELSGCQFYRLWVRWELENISHYINDVVTEDWWCQNVERCLLLLSTLSSMITGAVVDVIVW